MNFIADLHIHSHFSLATSKQLTPEYLDYWARIKGISVVGTGDFTHPKWLEELCEKTVECENGLLKLKDEYKLDCEIDAQKDIYFMLSAEISTIYKKYGKTRKIHNLVYAPNLKTAIGIQKELEKRKFNISSDGRPIIGFDAKNLLELCLSVNEDILFVPAHIWTPWFSVLGKKSGFNSVEECFEDLNKYIYAIETGLSSSPALNWTISSLDKYNLISNSDAHSPEKLGRNANIFKSELSYNGIVKALKDQENPDFIGTIDMYPEEGKYFHDGHRKCNVSMNPVESLRNNEICPVCGEKMITGVTSRIIELSDRQDISKRKNKKQSFSIIPLKELIAEFFNVKPAAKKVDVFYKDTIKKYGNEYHILLNADFENLCNIDMRLKEAIKRMRNKNINIIEGFDGKYGEISVFTDKEKKLFKQKIYTLDKAFPSKENLFNFSINEYLKLKKNLTISNNKNKSYNYKQLKLNL